MVKTVAKFVATAIRRIPLIGLILIVFYLLSVRVALNALPTFKGDIELYLSEQSQQKISIEEINSYWNGLDPIVEFKQISLNGSDGANIEKAAFHFSFIRSVWNLELRLKSASIFKAHLSLTQLDKKVWSLAGLQVDLSEVESSKGVSLSSGASLPSFLQEATLSLSELTLVVRDQLGLVSSLVAPDIKLNYQNDKIYASGRIKERAGTASLLNFSYESDAILAGQTISGVLFVEARSADFFGRLLKVYDWEHLIVDHVEGSVRAWLSINGTQLQTVSGEVQVNSIEWRASGVSMPPINYLASNFRWKMLPGQTNIELSGFGFSWAGKQCKETNIELSMVKKTLTELRLSSLDIQCWSRLSIAANLLPENLKKRLEVSDPSGLLKNVYLNTFVENEGVSESDFSLQAELAQVSLAAYDGTPSGSGLDGYISASSKGGTVEFSSNNFELGFPELFYDVWLMKHAEGTVSWDIRGDSVFVYSQGLRLWQDDESLVYGDFSLDINPDEREDYLNLAIAIQDIDFKNATKFVPAYLVGEDLHSWLNGALLSGKVSDGIYFGYGSTETNAPDHSFTSSILLNTQEGEVKFSEQWPHLTHLNTDIKLQNGKLSISSDNASIQGTELRDLTVRLPEKAPDEINYLAVTANTHASVEQLDYWMKESPISLHTVDIANQISIHGDVEVGIDLKIPMNDDGDVLYDVQSSFNGIDIEHFDSNIVFHNTNGVLTVSSDGGVQAENVVVGVFGEQAKLNISSKPVLERDLEAKTLLELTGRASVDSLFGHFGYAAPNTLSGIIPYAAVLTIPKEKTTPTSLSISSTLMGLRRDLPEPFRKGAQEHEMLDLNLLLKPSKTYLNAELITENGQNISSNLLFVDEVFSFGEVFVNGAQSNNPETKGLNISAKLEQAELETWIDLIKGFDSASVSSFDETDSSSQENIVQKIDVEVETLNAFGQEFIDNEISIFRNKGNWEVTVSGPKAKGHVFLSTPSSKLSLEFDRLHLSSDKEAKSKEPSQEPFDPRTIPELNFFAQKLIVNDHNYGAWRAESEKSEEGVIFRNLSGKIKGTTINGQLSWQQPSAGIANSILTLDLKGDKIENLFQRLKMEPLVSSDEYSASIAVVWPDEPHKFSFKHLSGSVDLKMSDGFLQTEDEKTGALRLFGILNAGAIIRRLKLDFSDLYKSGVGYDSLTLASSINQGVLTLKEPLSIKGPSGDYSISGTTDLYRETFDLDMLVELPLSQNVPLAALALGVPQIGGAVWLLDKLLGEPLTALTTARYDISGTWDKPVLDLGQALNASRKK